MRTLSEALDLKFARVQFTPDLMPADITGTTVLWEGPGGEREFRFQHGPVFANVVLADEINRATPKTQSALLEAMQEHTISVAGTTHRLEEPFLVFARRTPSRWRAPTAPEGSLTASLQGAGGVPTLAGCTDHEPHHGRRRPTRRRWPRATRSLTRGVAREVPVAITFKRFALRSSGDAPRERGRARCVRQFVRYEASPRGRSALCLGKVRR